VADDSSSSSDEEPIAPQPVSPTKPYETRLPPKAPPAKPRKSFAERLAKSQRDESMLPRVTGYCTCEAYKLLATQKFLTQQHGVKGAVIYDEALYARYEIPLRNGEGGFRVKSGELKQDDSGREYSSDSEVQVKSKSSRSPGTNGEHEDSVGSSAMLDGQMNMDEEGLFFSPPKEHVEERSKVHFLDEEDQKRHDVEESHDRTLRRRDSTPVDVNALSNLAERTLPSCSPLLHCLLVRVWVSRDISDLSICIFLRRSGVLELYRTTRKRYPSRPNLRKQLPTPLPRRTQIHPQHHPLPRSPYFLTPRINPPPLRFFRRTSNSRIRTS
jgi:hypothetical protein